MLLDSTFKSSATALCADDYKAAPAARRRRCGEEHLALLALNQLGLFVLGAAEELGTYAYVLRVLAFALILWGIVDKNVVSARRRR